MTITKHKTIIRIFTGILAAALIIGTPLCTRAEYRVENTLVPLAEKGYKQGDYRGSGLCWQFAQHIYYQIWGCFFYQNPGTSDDMLRSYPGGEYRRITADNARLFISAAPLGSVIRLQASPEGPDSTQGNRHSLILVDKDSEGCTLYHDWKGYSTVSVLTWEEFEQMFRTDIDFGYFKYIKYPAARELLYDSSSVEVTREMLITSRIYDTMEMVVKKR